MLAVSYPTPFSQSESFMMNECQIIYYSGKNYIDFKVLGDTMGGSGG